MTTDFADKILVFTDGACSGNPGVGGYGTVIVYPEGQVEELGAHETATTNNRMEMMAVIRGLRHIQERAEDVWVLTDSTYVIRGITQWIWGWKKRNWVNSEGKEVANKELWWDLDRLVTQRRQLSTIDWKYLRGHSGTPGNERCDQIAVAFTQKKFIELYHGSLLKYPVSIHDLPEDLSVPAPKAKAPKKKAHSYLSYVNGVLRRHASWPECEAVVKGRRGAKFKKSTSPAEEKEIVKAWGLSPQLLETL